MKTFRFIIFLSVTVCITACFSRKKPTTIKDLDDSMMDIRIYQENLGDLIEAGDLKDAEWLATGMDSLLQVMSNTFSEHRKFSGPFSTFYNQKLKSPMKGIQKAITANDTASARRHYRVLVRKCNSCHIDHDINKEVKY
jgi:hypothetical protein